MSCSATVLARVDARVACVVCVACASSFLVWVFAFALLLAFLEEGRLSSCCHHLHLFHFQLTRLDLLHIFGKNNTIATKLFEERHCLHMNPTANCSRENLVQYLLLLCVCLTASASTVPDARSHSPTTSSQASKPDSKPSACSHQSFAGIMIFCIKKRTDDSVCLESICCVSDAMPLLRWILQ